MVYRIGFQPVFIHTIERCFIPAHKLSMKLRVSTLGTISGYVPHSRLAFRPFEATGMPLTYRDDALAPPRQ
jgi:hypothetical protein